MSNIKRYNLYADGKIVYENVTSKFIRETLGLRKGFSLTPYIDQKYKLNGIYAIEYADEFPNTEYFNMIPSDIRNIFTRETYIDWIDICKKLNPNYGKAGGVC